MKTQYIFLIVGLGVTAWYLTRTRAPDPHADDAEATCYTPPYRGAATICGVNR